MLQLLGEVLQKLELQLDSVVVGILQRSLNVDVALVTGVLLPDVHAFNA